jgi:hypothetical protein
MKIARFSEPADAQGGDMIEQIDHAGETLAVVLRTNYRDEEIKIFIPDSFSKQLGDLNHLKEYVKWNE